MKISAPTTKQKLLRRFLIVILSKSKFNHYSLKSKANTISYQPYKKKFNPSTVWWCMYFLLYKFVLNIFLMWRHVMNSFISPSYTWVDISFPESKVSVERYDMVVSRAEKAKKYSFGDDYMLHYNRQFYKLSLSASSTISFLYLFSFSTRPCMNLLPTHKQSI